MVHPNLTFNDSQVSQTESQKHLGLIKDNKLDFNEQLKGVCDKISKTIGLTHQLFVKFLLDHILIMGTLFMIKLTMHHFTKSLNLFSILLV